MTTRDLDRIQFVSQHFNDLQGLRTAFPLGLMLAGYGFTHLFPRWPVVLCAGILLVYRWGRYYYRRRFGEVERLPGISGAELSQGSVYSPAGPTPLAAGRRPVNPFTRWFLAPVAFALVLVVILRAVSPPAALLTDSSTRDPLRELRPPVVETGGSASPAREPFEPFLTQGLYLACGACFVGVWLWRGRRLSQSYYLVLGILLLGLAVLGACLKLVVQALWDLGAIGIGRYLLPALAHYSLASILCGILLVFAGLLDHWQLARVLRPVREEQP
jgi:hypothetical protein